MGRELAEELQLLRKGRGVLDPKLAEHLGDQLRKIWAILPDTDLAVARAQIENRLDELSTKLPEEDSLRLIFRVVFALEPGMQFRFIKHRRECLMAKLECSERNLRFQEEDAIGLAASYLGPDSKVTDKSVEVVSTPSPDETTRFPRGRALHLDGWYWEHLNIFVKVISYDRLEAWEDHTIVATKEGLHAVGLLLEGIPDRSGELKFPYDESTEPSLYAIGDACHVGRQFLSPSCEHDLYDLRHPLAVGERCNFQITRNLDRAAASAYTFTPVNRCDTFEIKLEIGAENKWEEWNVLATPPVVRRVNGLPSVVIRDYVALHYDPREYQYIPWLKEFCWQVEPRRDDNLFYATKFEKLRLGLSYGLTWEWDFRKDTDFRIFLGLEPPTSPSPSLPPRPRRPRR